MSQKYQPASVKCVNCGAVLEPRPGGLYCSYCRTLHVVQEDLAPKRLTGDEHVRVGIEAFKREDYSLAVQELELAIQAGVSRYPRPEVYTILGNAYDAVSLRDKAIEAYRAALKLDRRYHKAWVAFGVVQRKQGNLAEAENCYAEALRLAPDYAELHVSLGVLNIFQGKVEQAIQSLEKAVRLDPAVAVAHGNLALAYALARRFDEAEASLRQAVALGYKEHKAIHERIQALKAVG